MKTNVRKAMRDAVVMADFGIILFESWMEEMGTDYFFENNGVYIKDQGAETYYTPELLVLAYENYVKEQENEI